MVSLLLMHAILSLNFLETLPEMGGYLMHIMIKGVSEAGTTEEEPTIISETL